MSTCEPSLQVMVLWNSVVSSYCKPSVFFSFPQQILSGTELYNYLSYSFNRLVNPEIFLTVRSLQGLQPPGWEPLPNDDYNTLRFLSTLSRSVFPGFPPGSLPKFFTALHYFQQPLKPSQCSSNPNVLHCTTTPTSSQFSCSDQAPVFDSVLSSALPFVVIDFRTHVCSDLLWLLYFLDLFFIVQLFNH